MTYVLREVGSLGAIDEAKVDADFAKIAGAKGTDVRRMLQSWQAFLDTGKKAPIAAPYSSGAWDFKSAADALQYEIDKRAELKSDAPVPGWLLEQIAGHTKKLLVASEKFSGQTPPLLPFIGGALPFVIAPDLRPPMPDLPKIPLWVKVAGAGAGLLLLLVAVRTVQSSLTHLAPAPLRGVPSKGRRDRRRKR